MIPPKPWWEMTHEELYAAVHSGAGPGASMLAESRWRDLEKVIVDAEARMHAAAARSAEGWEGSGADGARSGMYALNSWVLGATTDAQTTLSAIISQGVAAERLRSAMPAPITEQLVAARDDADVNVEDEDILRGTLVVEEEARWRAESAQRAMGTYYNVSVENQHNIDFWTTPPTVVVEAVLPAAGAGPPGSGRGDVPEFAGVSGSPLPAGSVPVTGVPAGVDGAVPGLGGPVVASLPPSGLPLTGGPDAGGAGVGGAGGAGAAGGSSVGGSGVGGVAGGGAAGTGGAVVGPVAGWAGSGGGVPAAGGVPGARGGVPLGGVPGGAGGVPGGVGAVPVSGRGIGGATPVSGPGALPPGAGGRGPRNVPVGGPSAGGAWPGSGSRGVLPGAPAGGSPTWRDVVAGLRGGAADPVLGRGGAADSPGGPRAGGGVPRPEVRAVATPPATDVRGGTGHGFYPPMGAGTAGGQGENRRRAPFLVDDSGVFEVDVPYTDPVIGAVGPADREDRR